MLLKVLCIILCYSVLSSWCYAAWFPTSNCAAWPSLTDVMLLNVLTSHRVTLFGLVFMMLRCLVFSTSCLATKRMNFISIVLAPKTIWEHKFFVFGISSVTSCHFLVSARWGAQNLQILWRNWWSKDNNSLSSSRNQLTFIYFYLTAKACISALGMKRPGTPSNLSLSSKRRAAPGKSCIYSIRQINAKRP